MIGLSPRAFIAGWIIWLVSFAAAAGDIPADAPERDGPVRNWRIEGVTTIRGTLIEFGRDAILIREESGHLEKIPFEILDPADLFRALKWEEERLIFPHLAGLEFETLIFPQKNLPLDEALAFIWRKARELRPSLSEKPPRVELAGARTMPIVSANINGRLRAVHAVDLLCRQVGGHWTLEDSIITEADWVYYDGMITVGRTAAMRELEVFKQKERLLADQRKLAKLIADAAGFTVEVEIHIEPR